MRARILIIDDNATNLKLATDVLSCEGHIIANAENAQHALEVLAQFHPDLILMDISMPGMDGLTLTRQLKADPSMRQVPIVALTASAMKGDEIRIREAGCDGYITKPIDTRQFPNRIAAFLEIATSRPAWNDESPHS
jgi:CheY-like chemotaxis protein